jgi:hypothetical protein
MQSILLDPMIGSPCLTLPAPNARQRRLDRRHAIGATISLIKVHGAERVD